MEMIDANKEVTTKENNKTRTISINLKVPEELLIKIYDKIKDVYEETGYHPHLLILSTEYAKWFTMYLHINEYLKFSYDTIVRFNGVEIQVTQRQNIIEVY